MPFIRRKCRTGLGVHVEVNTYRINKYIDDAQSSCIGRNSMPDKSKLIIVWSLFHVVRNDPFKY